MAFYGASGMRKSMLIGIIILFFDGSIYAQQIAPVVNIPSWLLVSQRAAGYPIYVPQAPIFAAGGSSDYVNSWGDYHWNNFYDQSVNEEPEKDFLYDNFPAILAGKELLPPPPTTTLATNTSSNSTDTDEIDSTGDAEDTSISSTEESVDTTGASTDVNTVNATISNEDIADATGLSTDANIIRPEKAFLENLVSEFSETKEPAAFKPDATQLLGILRKSLSAFLKTTFNMGSKSKLDLSLVPVSTVNESISISSRAIPVEKMSENDILQVGTSQSIPSNLLPFLSASEKAQELNSVMLLKEQQIAFAGNEISKRAENLSVAENVTQPLVTRSRYDFPTSWGNFSIYPFQLVNNLVANLTIPTGVIKLFDWVKGLAVQSGSAVASTATPLIKQNPFPSTGQSNLWATSMPLPSSNQNQLSANASNSISTALDGLASDTVATSNNVDTSTEFQVVVSERPTVSTKKFYPVRTYSSGSQNWYYNGYDTRNTGYYG